MARSVLVYRGEGAGWRSVRSTCESVERLLAGPLKPLMQPLKVDTISTSELLEGRWTQHAALLVMPGGADLPYVKHLNGRGNTIIKGFVHGGGSYLGLCAGAYYACARVVFEPGTALEVVGERELAFFPGIARGAAFPGFDYLTEAGSVAAQVQFSVQPQVLCAVQRQQQQQQPEQQQEQQQQQQQQEQQWLTVSDYCNGGPYFTAQDGSADVAALPGVTMLAEYCQVPLSAAHAAVQEQQPGQQLKQQQQGCVRRAAAVRCSVGEGVAVLCGTHPELGPAWLDDCGESNAREGPQPHKAASIPAAAGPAGSSPLDPRRQQQQQQQQEAPAPASRLQLLVQDAASSPPASSGGQQQQTMAAVMCNDLALAAHAQQLRRELEAGQEGRDLFLCSLLLEALPRYRVAC